MIGPFCVVEESNDAPKVPFCGETGTEQRKKTWVTKKFNKAVVILCSCKKKKNLAMSHSFEYSPTELPTKLPAVQLHCGTSRHQVVTMTKIAWNKKIYMQPCT